MAVLSVGGAMFDEAMAAAVEQGDSALERLRSIGRFHRRYWSEHPEYFSGRAPSAGDQTAPLDRRFKSRSGFPRTPWLSP